MLAYRTKVLSATPPSFAKEGKYRGREFLPYFKIKRERFGVFLFV
jgi:hypothetical protein